MKFSKMQERHELLLELQEKNKPISEEVLSYIDDARIHAENYSPEEREIVRANLRYWAAYVFEQTGDYPDTELRTIAPPNKLTMFLKNLGVFTFITFVALVFVLGLVQLSSFVTILRNSGTSPKPPQIVIYDNGGVFFISVFSVFALFIIFLQIIIFRRQTAMLFSNIGKRVTEVVSNVRKSLVGGARGKPLASLRIIEGPYQLINQELKIFTETVKLGRDPQKSDLVFFSPDMNSSVSGLHARIERVNGNWRIVAISTTRSETFINDAPIPFNEPLLLKTGMVVRLGYPAQLPVVFEFIEIADSGKVSRSSDAGYRTTDVRDNTIPNTPSGVSPKKNDKKNLNVGQDDDIFNEYRNR